MSPSGDGSVPTPTFYGSICGTVDHHYFNYSSSQESGYSGSRQMAKRIEARLRRASGIMLDEAAPLQWAIDSHNRAATIGVLSYLQQSVCPAVGVTPTT
jgi:hypothetical protein